MEAVTREAGTHKSAYLTDGAYLFRDDVAVVSTSGIQFFALPPSRSAAVGRGRRNNPALKSPHPFARCNSRARFAAMMVPWGGVGCCLSAAALYLLGRSSGRFRSPRAFCPPPRFRCSSCKIYVMYWLFAAQRCGGAAVGGEGWQHEGFRSV
jgi:hypothetical protein